MDQELVRYSRAGDVFHYRWTARRCLRMISPKSLIRHNLSELKGTIEGFAKRYNEHLKDNLMASVNILFVLVSNRSVSEKVKENIKNVISGGQVDKRFLNTLSKYVNLQPHLSTGRLGVYHLGSIL